MNIKECWQDFLTSNKKFDSGLWPLIEKKYSEPHRKYHTLNHINYCLSYLCYVSPEYEKDKIELVIWFHDVVYDTRRNDNEEQSAKLMKSSLLGSECWGEKYLDEVADMILATKHNSDIITPSEELKYFLDIDLSILGADEETYRYNYSKQIRKEYSWVPEEIYKAKRAEILQGFLDRDYIYNTDIFRNDLEKQARENIKLEIERLTGG